MSISNLGNVSQIVLPFALWSELCNNLVYVLAQKGFMKSPADTDDLFLCFAEFIAVFVW